MIPFPQRPVGVVTGTMLVTLAQRIAPSDTGGADERRIGIAVTLTLV